MAGRLGEAGGRQAAALRREMAEAAGDDERDRLLGDLGKLLGRAQAVDPLPEEEGEPLWVDARGNAETWEDVLRLQAEGIEPAAFAAVSCPVLMLHGDEDPHPGPATCDLLRSCIPQIRYRGFARCGHRPWAERHAREPFLAALREWLGEPGA
jgi:pimeloyl-ACP methyl ester carboxylesterase